MGEGFTIAGGGLAGCTLAWALRERGCQVCVVDRGDEGSATRVAAGLVTPITGPNWSKSWRFEELWPAALAFYRAVEESVGRGLFHELPMLRLLDSEEQVAKWSRRLETPGYAECLAAEELQAGEDLYSEFGGVTLGRAGYLDTGSFIEATKAELGEDWRVGELAGPAGDGVTVFCEGLAAAGNPLFDWVPFRPAKGEVLTVAVPGLAEDRIVNRGGVWLLPIGGGRFRAGATYDWGAVDCQPTAGGRSTIEARLGRLLRVPFEVLEHRAGVRPVVRASKLLCGLHPARDDVGFFNGLGSKGVLTAPLFAEQFAAFLCGEGQIDPEVDLRKNM